MRVEVHDHQFRVPFGDCAQLRQGDRPVAADSDRYRAGIQDLPHGRLNRGECLHGPPRGDDHVSRVGNGESMTDRPRPVGEVGPRLDGLEPDMVWPEA